MNLELYQNISFIMEIRDYLQSKNENQINRQMLDKIDIFLKNNCQHDIEEDDIDITPDRSMHIRYCRICQCDFTDK